MIKEAIATGDTVEQAFEAACISLGVESHDAKFEILEMPVKKKFGLFGGTLAKVRAYVEESPAQVAADYLKNILSHMGLQSVEIAITEQESGALLSLTGEDIGFIIGHRGETLDSLQYLAGLVANHIDDAYYRVTLDIANYREKRKETLEILGRKIAIKAVKSGRNCTLEPMNPYERRIIHTAVQTVDGAKSWSEGEETNRHVVIGPENGEKVLPRKTGPYNKSRDFNSKNQRRSGGYNKSYDSRPPKSGTDNSFAKPAPKSLEKTEPQPVQKNSVAAPLYGRIEVKK